MTPIALFRMNHNNLSSRHRKIKDLTTTQKNMRKEIDKVRYPLRVVKFKI